MTGAHSNGTALAATARRRSRAEGREHSHDVAGATACGSGKAINENQQQ